MAPHHGMVAHGEPVLLEPAEPAEILEEARPRIEEHSLDIEGNAVRELYDVAILPGVRRPMLIGFKSDDVRFMIRPTPGAMAET